MSSSVIVKSVTFFSYLVALVHVILNNLLMFLISDCDLTLT